MSDPTPRWECPDCGYTNVWRSASCARCGCTPERRKGVPLPLPELFHQWPTETDEHQYKRIDREWKRETRDPEARRRARARADEADKDFIDILWR